MQHQPRRRAAFGRREADLGIDRAIEKLGLAFGIDLDLGLPGRLNEQPSAVGADGQDKGRRDDVAAGIAASTAGSTGTTRRNFGDGYAAFTRCVPSAVLGT